jgi:hypothetical protein
MADAGGFRHPGLAVDHQRNGPERVERQIILGEDAGRERQHLQLIAKPELLQHPERAERPRAVAMIKRDHQVLPFARS